MIGVAIIRSMFALDYWCGFRTNKTPFVFCCSCHSTATGAKVFSDCGDQIEKMASRTGMSAEFLSELAHAARLSGTDIKTVETAVRGMQKTVAGDADELVGLSLLSLLPCFRL